MKLDNGFLVNLLVLVSVFVFCNCDKELSNSDHSIKLDLHTAINQFLNNIKNLNNVSPAVQLEPFIELKEKKQFISKLENFQAETKFLDTFPNITSDCTIQITNLINALKINKEWALKSWKILILYKIV
jgi:hypothetical protein